jgi:hypothetical protein
MTIVALVRKLKLVTAVFLTIKDSFSETQGNNLSLKRRTKEKHPPANGAARIIDRKLS